MEKEKEHIFEGGKTFFVFASSKEDCFNCAYCVLSGVDYLKETGTDFEFKDLEIGVNPSKIHPSLKKIPVSINNAFGDPGIQWKNTLEKLADLESTQHEGPVGIITKSTITKDRAKALSEFDLKIAVLQSVSNLPQIIEPPKYSNRLISIENLTNAGVATLPYFRPIIPGFNDSDEIIKKTMQDTSNAGAKALVYSGLLGTKSVLGLLEKKTGVKINPPEGYSQWQEDHKLISKKTEAKIKQYATENNIYTFKKTSCGITYVLDLDHDFNVHYTKPEKYDCESCVNLEKCTDNAIEQNNKNPTEILKIIGAIGKLEENQYEGPCKLEDVCNKACASCTNSKGRILRLNGEYTQGEIGLVRWMTNTVTTADKIKPTNIIRYFGEL